jgi:hypothetical protein
MSKFHVNGKGEAGECRAEQGRCPFGGADEHYTSPEAAREAYEKTMGAKKGLFGFGSFRKRKARGKTSAADPVLKLSAAGDFRRYQAILALRDSEGWDVSSSGELIRVSESGSNTYQALSKLEQADRGEGNMFERADRLKDAYAALRASGKLELPSYAPEAMSRQAYLQMVAPATTEGVALIHKELARSGANVVSDQKDTDVRIKELRAVLRMPLETSEDRQKLLEHFQAQGWATEARTDGSVLFRAVRYSQGRLEAYGDSLEREAKLWR